MIKMGSYFILSSLSVVLSAQTTPWIPSNTKTIDLVKSTEPATNTSKGRIWVAADGKLHYKDTLGVDIEVGAGDITTLAWTPPGTGGVATTQQEVNQRYISVLDYLNATDRAKALAGTIDYDATYAFTAAMNRAVATGIGKVYAPGRYAANIVISQPGVVIKGGGMQAMTGTPVTYIAPYNIANPVIQIGNDTGYVSGSGVEDLLVYSPSSNGTKGVVFAGGAYKSYARNLQVRGFTTSGLEFRNDDVYPCSFNRADNISVLTTAQGAYGIAFIDLHTVGTGWTTAIEVSNFESSAANGYQIFCDSANATISNAYLQCSYSGKGILFKKSGTYSPALNVTNIDVDSMANPPTGWPYVSVVYDGGVDYRVAAQWANTKPITGWLNSGGSMMVIAGHTTGSITNGQPTLTVASTTGIRPGRQVHVPNAGPSNGPLIATVNSISGLVLTLDTNASATVTGGDVGYGDLSAMETAGGSTSMMGSPGILWRTSDRRNLTSSMRNLFYRPGASGSIEPWSTTGVVMDTDYNKPLFVVQPNAAALTVSTITQSGTTVTLTSSGSHNAAVGDLIYVDGCNEPGVNGTYTVASRVSATELTYTSGTSQTLAAVTGTPTVQVNKVSAWRNGRLELPAGSTGGGIAIRDNNGTVNRAMYQDQAGNTFYLLTPNTTNGLFSATWGSSVTTGTGFAFGNSSTTKARFTGNGVLGLAPATAPSSTTSYGQIYTNTSDSRVYAMDPNGVATILTLDRTITTAGTTGAQTINKPVGSVNFAAGATSLVVTNSLVTASTPVFCSVGTNDATMKSVSAVSASGSFTIYANAAATAETRVYFWVTP